MKKICILLSLLLLVGCNNKNVYQEPRVLEVHSVLYHYERELEQEVFSGFQYAKLEVSIMNNTNSPFSFEDSYFKVMTDSTRFFKVLSITNSLNEKINADTVLAKTKQSYSILVRIPDTEIITLLSYDDYRGELFDAVVPKGTEVPVAPIEQPIQEKTQ